ncbi:MAG: ABC transporter permease [Microbacteriaceae bacterium]|nr:ABC transporter permease [Microbacteriaceae bacterium]NBS86228.1 ABC transporter permease [Micrococcales bacterium]
MAFAAFGSNNSSKPSKPTKTGKVVIALLAPGLAYLGAFFLTPLIALIMVSLQIPDPAGGYAEYVPALEIGNYGYVIAEYLPHILRSFAYALAATVLALLISYPLAYFIGVKARPWPMLQKLMLTLVIAPFFISFLLRTLAWKQLFSNESWIVTTLQDSGLLDQTQYVVGTPFMVIFGLTYNFIPFMTLPLYTSLERLDIRYLEAGSDLYASPAKVFRKVTLPLSMPGIISGTLLTFIPIAGDYVNASGDFLGSSSTAMIGNVIESNYLQINDYPSASALSVLLMGVILVLVSVYVRKSGTEDLL